LIPLMHVFVVRRDIVVSFRKIGFELNGFSRSVDGILVTLVLMVDEREIEIIVGRGLRVREVFGS